MTRQEDIPQCGTKLEICNPSCLWEIITDYPDDTKCPLSYEFCRHTYECCLRLSALLGDHTIHVVYPAPQPECSLAGMEGDIDISLTDLRGSEEEGLLRGEAVTAGDMWTIISSRTGCYDFYFELLEQEGENHIEADVALTDPDTITGTATGYFSTDWNPLGGPCEIDISGW